MQTGNEIKGATTNVIERELRPGDQIKGAKTYTIKHKLGAGATSQVYLAHLQELDELVALKVLHADILDDAELAKSFFLEAEILRNLYREEINDQGGDVKHAIPNLYETQRDDRPRFLAMELARGESLENILERPPSHIEEEEALAITAKVARVLHLLHNRLERSYTDFQLGNIYWDKPAHRVQVIDWNHVSEIKKGNPQDDLALLGLYFYQMLTGKQADISGEHELDLEKRAGPRWSELSLGTRRLVTRMLHHIPTERFSSAKSLYDEAQWLTEQWKKTGLSLATEIGKYLVENAPNSVDRAETLFDLARRKGGVPESALTAVEDQIRQRGGEVGDPLQPGRVFYNAGDYRKAQERWQKLASEKRRLAYCRWATVAGAAINSGAAFTQIRPLVDNAVHALEHRDYEEALRLLGELPNDDTLLQLNALTVEAEARRLGAQVKLDEQKANSLQQNGFYSEANEAFERAAQAVDQLATVLKRLP